MQASTSCIESTSERLWRGLGEAANTATEAAYIAAQHVSTAYNWAGRKVEKLCTEYLPERVAKVVSAAIWALPYTLGVWTAPGFISDATSGLALGLWGLVPREIDETIGKENRQRVYTGIRNGYIIRTGLEVVIMAATLNWWMLVPIIRHIFIAVQSHSLIAKDTPAQRFGDNLPKVAEEQPTQKVTEQADVDTTSV